MKKQFASLGEAIRSLREQRQLSLRGLAQRIGVSAPFLSDVERNRRSTDKLDALAKALQVSVEELEALDGRIPTDLKEWLLANPGVVALLKEWQSSQKAPPPDVLKALAEKLK
jgi:transcriptional regulator with XRE-family HTH domain